MSYVALLRLVLGLCSGASKLTGLAGFVLFQVARCVLVSPYPQLIVEFVIVNFSVLNGACEAVHMERICEMLVHFMELEPCVRGYYFSLRNEIQMSQFQFSESTFFRLEFAMLRTVDPASLCAPEFLENAQISRIPILSEFQILSIVKVIDAIVCGESDSPARETLTLPHKALFSWFLACAKNLSKQHKANRVKRRISRAIRVRLARLFGEYIQRAGIDTVKDQIIEFEDIKVHSNSSFSTRKRSSRARASTANLHTPCGNWPSWPTTLLWP